MKREFAYGLFGFGLAASIASLIVYLKQQVKKRTKKGFTRRWYKREQVKVI